LDSAVRQTPQAKAKTDATSETQSRDKEAAIAQEEAGAITGGAVGQKTPAELRSNERSAQAFAVIRPAQNYSSLLKAPSGSPIWRAGKGGIIDRSTDAGTVWISQVSPSQEDWLAGAAVSDTVCWVLGRNGAIARTLDGVRWERVAPPAQAAGTAGKLPDWTGIAARDAQSVTVTSRDGRHFATQDGGKSWLAQ